MSFECIEKSRKVSRFFINTMTLNLDMFLHLLRSCLACIAGLFGAERVFLSHAERAEFAENTRAIASVCHPVRSLPDVLFPS